MKDIILHTKGAVTATVTDKDTASALGSGSLQVFATPMMVAKMEESACQAVAPFLEDGETTVGTALDIQHVSATPVGMTVTAEAEIVAVNGREITFQVSAKDEAGTIGNGTHKRFLVYAEKFQAKADKRGQS